MSEIKQNGILFILWSTIAGKISFLISSVLIAMVMARVDIAILDTIFAGGIGGLLLGIFLHKHHKIGKMTLAGTIAVPVGFWAAFILAGGMDLIFTLIGENADNPNINGIVNVIGIVFMGLLCGAIFGAIIYGRKSIGLFSAVGGLISFPFGLLVGLFNSGHPIKAMLENQLAVLGSIDLNFLAIITSFGIGIGLSMGLYEMLTHNQTR